MKIELKSIKYSASLSQETAAFTAVLWVDGKKVAECMNSGHGGCTNVRALAGCREILDAVNTQSLALLKSGFYDQSQAKMEKMFGVEDWHQYLLSVRAKNGKMTGLQPIETVVDHMLEEHLDAKHMQKIVAKERKIAETWSKAGIRQMIRVEDNGTVEWIPVQAPASTDDVVGAAHKKHPTARVTVLSTWEAMGK